MADVFNKEPVEFVDLNELFPVLNSAVGLTYEQFRILVENTFWLKNREEIGIVKAYIVSGSSEFGALWLSETNGGEPLVPDNRYIYVIQTTGQFKNKLFSWNGSVYEQLAKDSDNNYTNLDKSKVDKLITNGDGTKYLANDGVYKTISGGGGIPEAPSDGHQYVRKDASWVKSSRIQSDDNFSYFEAGGNIINRNEDTEFIQMQGNIRLGRSDSDNNDYVELRIGPNYEAVMAVQDEFELQSYIFAKSTTNSPYNIARKVDLEELTLSATDVVVAVEDWESDETYENYPYKAELELLGMTTGYDPSVTFGLTEVESGNYAPICLSGTDSITIYAKEIPSSSITIPLIKGEKL